MLLTSHSNTVAYFLYKIYTVNYQVICFHNRVMEVEKSTCAKPFEVKFELTIRKLTPAQDDAGKRLFKRLIERAQSKGDGDGRG
jgi:hypothetical protein